jgi:hypothetical protein
MFVHIDHRAVGDIRNIHKSINFNFQFLTGIAMKCIPTKETNTGNLDRAVPLCSPQTLANERIVYIKWEASFFARKFQWLGRPNRVARQGRRMENPGQNAAEGKWRQD